MEEKTLSSSTYLPSLLSICLTELVMGMPSLRQKLHACMDDIKAEAKRQEGAEIVRDNSRV